MSSYNTKIVTAYFAEQGIPRPNYEWRFLDSRKWRFDLAWILFVENKDPIRVAVEVQGGIWHGGRHTRGAAMLEEWEKLNTAAAMGWRILYCQPQDLCMNSFAQTIKQALGL